MFFFFVGAVFVHFFACPKKPNQKKGTFTLSSGMPVAFRSSSVKGITFKAQCLVRAAVYLHVYHYYHPSPFSPQLSRTYPAALSLMTLFSKIETFLVVFFSVCQYSRVFAFCNVRGGFTFIAFVSTVGSLLFAVRRAVLFFRFMPGCILCSAFLHYLNPSQSDTLIIHYSSFIIHSITTPAFPSR